MSDTVDTLFLVEDCARYLLDLVEYCCFMNTLTSALCLLRLALDVMCANQLQILYIYIYIRVKSALFTTISLCERNSESMCNEGVEVLPENMGF